MSKHRVEMRLSGDIDSLGAWIELMSAMAEKGIIQVLEKSEPYKNRGDSQIYRIYIKADFSKQ